MSGQLGIGTLGTFVLGTLAVSIPVFSYTFTVTATDSQGAIGSQAYTLKIAG